jgi:nitrite reductase/ring-hydroxylating ferredoxin subunit
MRFQVPGSYREGGTSTRAREAPVSEFVRAAATVDIPAEGGKLFRHEDKRIALLRGDGGGQPVFAIDNRCPHEGYALVQGDRTGAVLTCAWHNWKFRLTDGKCLFGGENVRTYPVEIRGGDVFVDITDPAPETIAPQLFASLLEAMGDVSIDRLARDTMRLRRIGTPLAELVREGVRYGAPRAQYGWNHSLATLTDCLGIAAAFEGSLQALPVIQGLAVVSQTEVRRPERPRPDPVDPVAEYGSIKEGLAVFPRLVDAEQGEDAEALLLGLLNAGAPKDAIRHTFLTAITDHFLGYGHPMIYCQKAFELLDQIGWQEAGTVLGPLVPATTLSTRYDRLPYMRRYLAAWRSEEPDLSALISHPRKTAFDQAALQEALHKSLLDGIPEDVFTAMHSALTAGIPVPALIDEVAAAAATRLGRFDIDLDTDDTSDAGWLDVTHTLTYANALRWAWQADPSPEVLRGLLHAAWFVQWTSQFDARESQSAPRVRPSPGTDATAVLTAIRTKDPEGAVAIIKGFEGPQETIEKAIAQAAAEDNSTAPIMVAHAVKTARSAIEESRVQKNKAPLAAVARFLAAPKRERFVYRSTLDAIDFIQGRAKGDDMP